MEFIHMKGKNLGHILMFTLSTCAWCKKTKQFLNDIGVDYYYIDVDLLEGEDKRQAEKELYTYNPQGSFPTIIINDKHTIVGYSENEIRKIIHGE